jgi:hypothetical protein
MQSGKAGTMRDQKRTPETWATEADFITAPTLSPRNAIRIYSTNPGPENDFTIGYAVDMDKPTREANARLLAAALEALKSLFEHCAMVHMHWGENSNQKEADAAIAAARAVIAKAEARP